MCDRAKEENSPKKFREWDLAYDKDNKKVKSYIAENVNTFIDWIAPVVINDSTNWHYEVTEYNDVFCNFVFSIPSPISTIIFCPFIILSLVLAQLYMEIQELFLIQKICQ